MKREKLVQDCKGRMGSALIGLVVVIVLALIVFGVQKWMKSRTPDPDTAQNLSPWKEWRIREKSEKPLPEPREEQPKITKPLRFDANVELPDTGDSRGEVQMNLSTDGHISGVWSGTYYNSKKENFDIQGGGFEGKVYPGKIYRDEKGEDLSKMYFLTKGKFVIHRMSSDAKQYHINTGDIYVRGWLSPDFSVDSEIIITGDESYSETFHWKVKSPVAEK